MSSSPSHIDMLKPPAEPAKSPRARLLKYLFIALIVAIAGGALTAAWFFMSARDARAEVETLGKRIRAAGEPLTAGEMEAWYLGYAPSEAAPALEDLIEQLREFSGEESAALDEWNRINDEYGLNPVPRAEWTALEDLLAPLQPIIDALPEAASHEHAGFPLDFSEGMAIALPHLAPLRGFMRLLAMQAEIAAADGRYDEAGALLATGLRMVAYAEETPTAIGGLVGVAIRQIGAENMARILSRHSFPPAALDAVDAELARADPAANFRRAMIGERGIVLIQTRILYGDISNPLLILDYAAHKRNFTNILDAADPELPIHAWDFGKPPRYTLLAINASILAPSMWRSILAFRRDAAGIHSMRTALAVERYRTDHGAWPDSLEGLAGTYMDEVPLDPFDGNPLRYRVEDEGYILYSVNIDRQDGGGVKAEGRGEDAQGDWPFRVTRRWSD